MINWKNTRDERPEKGRIIIQAFIGPCEKKEVRTNDLFLQMSWEEYKGHCKRLFDFMPNDFWWVYWEEFQWPKERINEP